MFGLEIASYLFLGGLGGGLCAVAGTVGLGTPRRMFAEESLPEYRVLMKLTFAMAAAALVLGSLFLLADDINVFALRHLFFTPSLSYLSLGAWAIVVDMGLCLACVFFWGTNRAGQGPTGRGTLVLRLLHGACTLVGLVVALYTGLFLASMKAVPLWHTPWLPALFVLSSLSCGLVLYLALARACGAAGIFAHSLKLLVKADMVVVALEIACAFLLVWAAATAPVDGPTAAAGVASATNMVFGELAWVWWGCFVGLGLAVLLVFDVLLVVANDNCGGRLWSVLGPSLCVLAGAFALRYCVIMAGVHPALSF